jgi:hypothetical protein
VGIILGSTSLEPLLNAVLGRLRELSVLRAQGMLEGIAR